MSGDQVARSTGWTDDIVLLGPGEEPQVGRQAILEIRQGRSAALPGCRVVTYAPQIKTVIIAGEWAFEWGVFTASFVEAADSEERRLRGKLLRVLKRQPDGSWRIAIGMTNT